MKAGMLKRMYSHCPHEQHYCINSSNVKGITDQYVTTAYYDAQF